MLKTFNNRILLIDDDKDIWKSFKTLLRDNHPQQSSHAQEFAALANFESTTSTGQYQFDFDLSYASQGEEGFELVQNSLKTNKPYALAFIDIRMPPGWDGMETAAKIREIDPNIEIIIITAYSDRASSEIVEKVGTPEKLLFLRKPFDPEELIQFAVSLTAKWDTEHKEEQHRLSLEGVLDASPAAIFTVDNNCKVLSWNKASEAITGFSESEIINRDCPLKSNSPDIGCKNHCFSKRALTNLPVELEINNKAGDKKIIYITARTIKDRIGTERRVIAFLDITGRKAIEAQLFQGQKMEAIGSLVGGIAHDLNNMLTPIFGFNELAKIEIGPAHNAQQFLDNIDESAKRAADLLRRILSFSRKHESKPEPLDLNKLIENFNKMLRRLIREDIELCFELAPELPPILADPGQMEQVIMNLTVNARDAIENGGKITIITSHKTTNHIVDTVGKPLTDTVLLQIHDTGAGMDIKTASQIFEPFFTTKEAGKGTGMGLATVFSIVKHHGGQIQLDTAPGRGATFNIYLPVADKKHTYSHKIPSAPKEKPLGGNESVLVVEDSKEIRNLAQSMLGHFGYKTTAATNGAEALEIFQKNPEEYDFLLTDLVMPKLNGKELAEEVRKIKPEIPVLFMTGHNFQMDLKNLLSQKNTAIIKKPFTLGEITKEVRSILTEPKQDPHGVNN